MSVKAYSLETIHTDVLVIGAGGAGMRAALAAAKAGANVLVLSKVPVLNSHTAAAKGGINAALGNRTADDWRWHMYDTVRGADWLGDQDAIARMCEAAPATIIELEHMGIPFSRAEDGQIYQRAYGGQSVDFGKGGLAYRACAVADRIGHALLYTLHGEALRAGIHTMEECIAIDLLMEDAGGEKHCHGALAWQLETGELFDIRAKTTILATGGCGQVYASTTTASICTGDGGGMAWRAGLPLQDMEFVQFHPTALYGSGILISEAARAEGGELYNADGERFMERYAPKYKDLASRDVISRAIMQEIREGRGTGPKRDHVELRLQHLSESTLREKLPSVVDVVSTIGHMDVRRDAIPVLPAAHYTMGGIPTDSQSRVVDAHDRPVGGLMAVGEAACTSVHGANRLGCNSLLDLVVFGKQAGEWAATQRHSANTQPELREAALARFDRLRHAKGGLRPRKIRRAMGWVMHEHASIIRNESLLKAGVSQLGDLTHQATSSLGVSDSSLLWNTELAEALELDNLLAQATSMVHSALARTESRGAHFRDDFPTRDDGHWLTHSLCYAAGAGKPVMAQRAVRTGDELSFPPEERAY